MVTRDLNDNTGDSDLEPPNFPETPLMTVVPPAFSLSISFTVNPCITDPPFSLTISVAFLNIM